MDAIELAENVVGLYTIQRMNSVLYSQKVCGCHSCAARSKGWVQWIAGDDGDDSTAYTGHQVPSPGHGQFV